jgi:hypothetical protein
MIINFPFHLNYLNSSEGYYWFFSASAQSIAAFIAVLLTGFAIVINMMASLENQDDTLDEIINKLKSKYYKYILSLSILTGLAIICSLLMVYFNASVFQGKQVIIVITVILNILSIAVGLVFMLYIINPNRYARVANSILKKETEELEQKGQDVDVSTYISKFTELEKRIRQIVEFKDLMFGFEEFKDVKILSFKKMLDLLLYNEIIDDNFYKEILRLSKVRNSVVHGHQDTIDEGFVDLVDSALERMQQIKST